MVVVECKASDVITKFEKGKSLQDLANIYSLIKRTDRASKILRSKWQGLKKNTKTEYNKINNNEKGIANAPCYIICMSNLDESVLNTVGSTITEISNKFDSDMEKGLSHVL